eukprot:CAMPEP_0172472266 /NCGR_PEP_ID=MMETSP1065-20121228/68246_1 /TAXON_ID=265537 /ORGANISM="Amphiprora paludosa, Strain CCMP125" /LENGTH=453 /DNA_ID=CAMNT_0013230397 /DNA_START=312 /DNA_END=1674 /DNA_ORIENTATION=+
MRPPLQGVASSLHLTPASTTKRHRQKVLPETTHDPEGATWEASTTIQHSFEPQEENVQAAPIHILTTRGGGASLVTTAGAHSPLVQELLQRAKVGFQFEPQEENDPPTKPERVALRGGGASLVTTAGAHSPLVQELLQRAKVGFYFALWYALNIVYNIVNKKVLNVWAAPMTVASLQLGIGAVYAMMLWTLGLRSKPVLEPAGKQAIRQVGLWHAVGQLCTVLSLGAGPVSFTHIVKALEPFFSAIVSAIYLGKWMKAPVYATLLPVVGGVGYACLKERSFSWMAFGFAMCSNLAFALRAVLSKVAMTVAPGQAPLGTNLTPPNVFALVTMGAFVLSLPVALLGEGSIWSSSWAEATQSQSSKQVVQSVLLSGLFHYLNNEVMYLALGSVHPVTLAVGNTMKRVFIMVASVMVFRNEISVQAAIGSAVGIGGVLLYSLTKQHYERLEAQSSKS